MTSRLGRNLRQGHRAEGVGVEMLRAICAVAQVPHPEDVGFDAVATLLRRDGAFLMAEDSFCVQFKARSVREIVYDAAAYKWLRDLDLPLFIGSVDLASQSMEVYTTHHLASRVDARSYTAGVLYLDRTPSRIEPGVVHQWLGPPVLQWSAQEGESDQFQAMAYAILRDFVRAEAENRRLRAIHTVRMLRWETNQAPTSGGTGVVGHPSDLREDVRAAAPYLQKLASHFLMEETPTPEGLGFYLLLKWMGAQGAEEAQLLGRMAELALLRRYQQLEVSASLALGRGEK